jgi:nucleotide-binding universal stress UspA family protein
MSPNTAPATARKSRRSTAQDLTDQEHLVGQTSQLAKRLSARLLVEHVGERNSRSPDVVYFPTDPGTAARLIDQVVDRLVAEGLQAHGEVSITLSGFKAQTIMSAAAESGADMIVMEARRFSPLLALVGMSPVHRVIQSGRWPVVVVPAARRHAFTDRLTTWLQQRHGQPGQIARNGPPSTRLERLPGAVGLPGSRS